MGDFSLLKIGDRLIVSMPGSAFSGLSGIVGDISYLSDCVVGVVIDGDVKMYYFGNLEVTKI